MFEMKVWGAAHTEPQGQMLLEQLARKRYPKRMDTKQQQEIERREKILTFWSVHGLAATKDAFGVGRATLFRWKRDPVPKSQAHRHGYQKRVVQHILELEIIRLRTKYPRLGKEKLAPLLREFCAEQGMACPAEATVGRIIGDLKHQGKLPTGAQLRLYGKTGKLSEKPQPSKKKKLRRGGYIPQCPGDLLQVDGVLINTLGQRRYTFTAVDLVSRWAFSKTYRTASSRNGADFLAELLESAPFDISHIQTDNGPEFMKEFRETAEKTDLTHFFNWVKQPKYQGWVERFNRTIQESFLNWHYASLAGDPDDFNKELSEWVTFYNTKRVHRALGRSGQRLTPLQYLTLTKESQTG